MRLKSIANEIGFDLPFYTRTGWPELASPVPFGELIPLYGDYADGFWERSLQETAGNYYKAFNFKSFRSSTAIATEQLGEISSIKILQISSVAFGFARRFEFSTILESFS